MAQTMTGTCSVGGTLSGTPTTVTAATIPGVQGVGTAGPAGTPPHQDAIDCFSIHTLIDTPDGPVPVETLSVGDLVNTIHNGPRPVTWIGTGTLRATRGRRTAATPVIVCRGALGDHLPYEDLRLTRAHALYIDGVLIPVDSLINHKT